MKTRHLTKILGLSLLAAVAVMAVSASAAQAGYLLLLNGASVSTLHLTAEILHGTLEAENGLQILCTGGSGKATLNESGGAVSGLAEVLYEGCVWVGSQNRCEIEGGHITAHGEGAMMGEELILAIGEPFAIVNTVDLGGCTVEGEEEVAGSVSIKILDASTSSTVHLVDIEDDELFLGNSEAHLFEGEAHVRDENPNATWAIDLVP